MGKFVYDALTSKLRLMYAVSTYERSDCLTNKAQDEISYIQQAILTRKNICSFVLRRSNDNDWL